MTNNTQSGNEHPAKDDVKQQAGKLPTDKPQADPAVKAPGKEEHKPAEAGDKSTDGDRKSS